LTIFGASTPAKGPRRSSRASSAALRTMTNGSAPSAGRSRRRAPATIASTRAGRASKRTLPLAMNVLTFAPPARANASRSASFFTRPLPPTFTARTSAT